MKPSYTRRYRSRSAPAKTEAAFFKKESQHEQSFFDSPTHDAFFQPNVTLNTGIMRKCDDCEKEDKKIKRMEDNKEEEKIMKMQDKEKEKVQRKREEKEEDNVQRTEDKDEEKLMKMEEKEEEKIQKKETAGSSVQGKSTSNYISSLNGKGQTLSPQANHFFSSKMGYDFSKVKIHADKDATESAKAINAKAYTTGNNVVFNEGQYNTESSEGKRLIAHELTHIIQQDKQQNNSIDRLAEETQHTAPVNSGKWSYHKTTHYGFCQGVKTHGKTEANYSDKSSNTKDKRSKSTTCPEACDDCIVETGTLKSEFKTNPTISLPPIPRHLNPCEKKAVKAFIEGRLTAHENEHARRFNTYRGIVETPYTFNGCARDLKAFLKNMHMDIETARRSASDALSGKIDPFFAVFDCECPDPETKTKD